MDNFSILAEGIDKALEISPLARRIFLKLNPPSLAHNQADADRVRAGLKNRFGKVAIPLGLMQTIPSVCRNGNWQVTATVVVSSGGGWEIADIRPGNASGNYYGLSIDIGTTTVVVYLVDLNSGRIIDYAAGYNGQVKLGQDILTRIYVASEPDGKDQLRSAVLTTVNNLIAQVSNRNGIYSTEICAAAIGANTTMVHLLLGLDPSRIAVTPYIPVANSPGLLKAAEVGLAINPFGAVYFLPGVGSYVGGDIVAGVLTSGMHRSAELSLFVDIGTNVEVVLGNRDWLVACAGAAGPALEGGVAESGMLAEDGAIESVTIDAVTGKVRYSTIGNARARGICGSGLIDCLAELFLNGVIDRAGHFKNGEKQYTLVPASETATAKDIVITQNDINRLMRTKGAVNAALDLLLNNVGLDIRSIERFYASGAFGRYINLESAITIGLYPDLPREKMVVLGNTSAEGARQVLMSNQKRRESEEIAEKVTYFELIASQEFMNRFVGSIFLPHTNLEYFPSVKEKMANRRKTKEMAVILAS